MLLLLTGLFSAPLQAIESRDLTGSRGAEHQAEASPLESGIRSLFSVLDPDPRESPRYQPLCLGWPGLNSNE